MGLDYLSLGNTQLEKISGEYRAYNMKEKMLVGLQQADHSADTRLNPQTQMVTVFPDNCRHRLLRLHP